MFLTSDIIQWAVNTLKENCHPFIGITFLGVCAVGRFCRQADDADQDVELVESYANPGGLAVG